MSLSKREYIRPLRVCQPLTTFHRNNAGLQVSLYKVDDVNSLFQPTGLVDRVWSSDFDVNEVGWSFPIIKGNMNVAVEEVSHLACLHAG